MAASLAQGLIVLEWTRRALERTKCRKYLKKWLFAGEELRQIGNTADTSKNASGRSFLRDTAMLAAPPPNKMKIADKLLPHAQRRRCPAKSNILCAGEESDSLYLIIKGSVTILIEDNEGREMIVAYLNSGDFFGELGLFQQAHAGAERSAWVRAKTECEVAEISYVKFRELAQHDPELMFAIGAQIAERLRNTTRKVGDLAFLDVTGRVARSLLDLCKQPDAMTHPDGMQIKITRQEIGRIVGCSREMVGRVLKALEEQNLVHVRGKTMVVFGTR